MNIDEVLVLEIDWQCGPVCSWDCFENGKNVEGRKNRDRCSRIRVLSFVVVM